MTREHYGLNADAVQVLLRRDGRALYVRKVAGAAHGAGEPTVVGGHLEGGEPFDRAARRSAREETGGHVEARHEEFRAPAHYRSPRGGGRVGAVFVAQRRPGEPYDAGPDQHDGLLRVPRQRPPGNCHPYSFAIFRMLTEGPSYLAPNWMNSARGGSE
ncbi:NUDIX domain-containing protein [Streptomyces sp. NBC_01102]|uniref:NUDIX domain-containing protein n=1 Tax=Streptomyces sp. NBC_01102 TaxID=2903749 RepID=UPI003869666C|nr:NUDIX domain-containing protein [Streptomyces sp. NBC_01102]